MAGNLPTFIFFYILFFLPSVNGGCSYSSCASNMYPKDSIPFPFRTPDQPLTCGLPGFDLGCNSSNRSPLLSFPSGQSFTVEYIGKFFNSIWISDPQGCLPKKLLQTLNTSGTPFRFQYYTPFSLYSCPSIARLPYLTSSSPCSSINCGGGAPYSAVCVNKSTNYLENYGCEFIRDTMVPGSWDNPHQFASASSVALNWDMPAACRGCSRCYRSSKDSSEIKCKVLTPGVITTIIFVVIFTIVVISYILCQCCKRLRRGAINTDEARPNTTSSMNRQSNVTSGALQDTLDTYPIMVVGESGRMLSSMEDKTCPICLSDYASMDTLKTLPECLHKFHAECIDEWLIAKLICPICRTPPPL